MLEGVREAGARLIGSGQGSSLPHNNGIGGMAGTSGFDTDLNDAQWAIVAPLLPAAKPGGRPRTTCMRGVLEGVLYLLRTGCQWRLLPRCFPPWSTVHHYLGSGEMP